MLFPVHPLSLRRESVISCNITRIVALLEMLLTFCIMYWGKQLQGAVFLSFLFSTILAAVSWNAYLVTRRCYEHVGIDLEQKNVTLYNATGKVRRTLQFSEIVSVQIVHLSTITYVGSTPLQQRHPYICTSSAMKNNCYADVRSNPDCIVFAYNEYAYNTLQSACVALAESHLQVSP